ncbi:MAG TPA: serine/threonine-protein kinase, partial [Candidatus Limnocylindrales bacterium]|nr:serine/threonine-protein kinase [Candidatus Limnocylindrales bacterium]
MEPDPSHDERILRILEELTSSLRRTGKADVEAAARADPDLGDELRELWAMVEVTEEVAKPEDETLDAPRAPSEEGRPRDPLTPTPGDLRDHEILEEIGRGGMGVVYRARQKSLDRIVALKMMLRGPLASRAETDRFRAEAEAAARLDHPNIAPVYEVGAAGDQPYFTMRFVEGTTLARRLAEGPLPCRDAARLLAVIARAVHYAHERGVLHRDLKPQNILIGGDGAPYITDFGLAKRIEGGSSLTETGAILGTPSYMAPEHAAGRKGQVGPASDVYALGAILYHALTGRPPFQAATAVDVVLSVLGEDPLPPRLLNPKVDRDLEMITLKCLQKPADLRYASARALAEDLEAYQNGETISARTTGLRLLVSRAFRETHHAAILENWG